MPSLTVGLLILLPPSVSLYILFDVFESAYASGWLWKKSTRDACVPGLYETANHHLADFPPHLPASCVQRAIRTSACQDLHLSRRVGQQLCRLRDARLARFHVVLHARRLEPFRRIAIHYLSHR